MTKTLDHEVAEREMDCTIAQMVRFTPLIANSTDDAMRLMTPPDFATWAMHAGDDDLIDAICDAPRGELTERVSKAFATSNPAIVTDWLMALFRARAARDMRARVADAIDSGEKSECFYVY